jgi:hypothetical protein
MSKIKLTGSNSGYVEISSAADAGNLTLQLPTAGTALLGNAGNVFSGITTTGQLDINGSIDVSSTSVFNDDVTFTGASYNVLWDKSDNQLEFGTNAKLSFGASSDLQIHRSGTHSYIKNSSNTLVFNSDAISFTNYAGNSNRLVTAASGEVKLYYSDSVKLETTNTGAVVTGICTATSFSGSGEGLTRTTPLSHRNRIINGDMQISQRYGTTETTLNNAAYHWVLDRFPFYESTNGTATVTQVTSGYAASHTGSGKAMRIKTTGADTTLNGSEQLMVFQFIEAYNWEDMRFGTANAKSFTVSFSILVTGASSGNVTGTYCVNATNAPNYNRSYVKEYTVSSVDTWQRVSLTFPGDTSGTWNTGNGAGIRIGWSFAGPTSQQGAADTWHSSYKGSTSNQKNGMANVNNFYFITDIQVEEGTVATPFERRNYAEELDRCKRYYQQIGPASSSARILMGAGNGNARIRGTHQLVPEMRAAPTVTIDTSSENPTFYSFAGSPPGYSSLNSFVSTNKTFTWDWNTGTHNQAGQAFDVKGSGAKIHINAEIS